MLAHGTTGNCSRLLEQRSISYVRAMRQILVILIGCAAWSLPLQAADLPNETAAAIADRREAEERYKRLNADVQNLLETQELILKRQEALQQRLNSLADELHLSVREAWILRGFFPEKPGR